ncbi:MAG: hypothetical protein CMLOHMNK_01573 [Steroidobacteraceae bacterium]|nr:hypothetical protein [Steroidobacteraceae bacterium]
MHHGQGDWLPARAALHPTGLYLQLRDIAVPELHDPFMKETLARSAAPEEYVQIEMQDLGRAPPGSGPAGIIFHVARCGSTLVSQLLKLQGGCAVYAEPPPVNEILRPPQPWPHARMVAALRSLGAAFAAHAARPYVLKLTSWNTLHCDLLTEAFPDSPWVLCLRDPVEVCVSLLQRPPGWLLGTDEMSRRFATIVDPQNRSRSNEELVARTYAAFCDSVVRLDPGKGRLVEYAELPGATWGDVAPHFSLPVSEVARDRMAQAATRHAKAPVTSTTPFSGDAATKQAAASAELRRAVDEIARPALARLGVVPGFRLFGYSGASRE